jgi:hypothetical protein
MIGVLKKLSTNEAKKLIPSIDIPNSVSKEPVFILTTQLPEKKIDNLLQVEVSFLRCDRVGVFKK